MGGGRRPAGGVPAVVRGPLLAFTGGVDCSFLLSGLVGGVVYVLPIRVPSRRRHPERAWSSPLPRPTESGGGRV
ncbi:hypothetical protein LV779_35255 [Streptomyces thinghirensis]|nr:hypothetical protein [Streptomyces thinghirensis]